MSNSVTQAQLARLVGVSRQRVGQWVKDEKVSPEAISGEGRGLRIDVDLALASLRERLSPDEAFGLNGISTDLENAGGSTAELIKLEKLKLMRLEVAKKEAELEALGDDTVTLAEANTMVCRATELLATLLESVLRDVAAGIAAKTGGDRRLILHSMLEGPDGYKNVWRRWYARAHPAEASDQLERAEAVAQMVAEYGRVDVKDQDNP